MLFGEHNPSGKLTMSFPRSVGQVPVYYNHLNTGRPMDHDNPGKYTSRYFDEANGPLYPFGYGLSYTEFSLSPLRLSSERLARGATLEARVTLSNSGKRAGATVVQLYLQDPVASLSRPVKELRGFRKVMLEPGESREIVFRLGEADLKFYDSQLRHTAEPGEFKVFVGLDSAQTESRSFTPALKAPTAPPASPTRANGSASQPPARSQRPGRGGAWFPQPASLPPRRSAPRSPSMRPATPPTGCRAKRR